MIVLLFLCVSFRSPLYPCFLVLFSLQGTRGLAHRHHRSIIHPLLDLPIFLRYDARCAAHRDASRDV